MSEQDYKVQQNVGEYIFLTFTKELIRNTESYKKFIINEEARGFAVEEKQTERSVEKEIKEEVKESEKKEEDLKKVEKKYVQEIVREKIKRDSQNLFQLRKRTIETPSNEANPFKSFFERRNPQRWAIPPMPQIPEPRLPPTVQYLRPFPVPVEVDLKKLTPLVRDPFVRIIECNGPGENTVVMGTMGRKRTGIILDKEEIEETIKIFSEVTNIPISEGIFRVVFGKLIFSAIVSDVIGSKFIIKKMFGPPVSFR